MFKNFSERNEENRDYYAPSMCASVCVAPSGLCMVSQNGNSPGEPSYIKGMLVKA